MQKSKKNKILLVILLISMFTVIPSLLISTQRDIENPIENKNPNMIINTRPPQESSVYYENTTGLAQDVYLSGDYAYVADYTSGLAVIDISDSTNPRTPVYEDDTSWEESHGVYVSGDYAYVADNGYGLAVIDVSNPTNPVTVNYAPTIGCANGVYVSGDYAYVASGVSGLAVVDISDMNNPVITVSPNNFAVEYGYTGQSISWTATDANPYNYTIESIGTPIGPHIVVTPTPWANNIPVVYNIPDGFEEGVYLYTVNFTDDYGNSISNTVRVTITGRAIPFGNYFLIFIGFSVIYLILTKKRQIVREPR